MSSVRPTGRTSLFALWSGRVALYVIPQPDVAAPLAEAGRHLADRWTPLLQYARA
jgi:hypothetical protein